MIQQDYLHDGERLDDLQRNGYRIIQNPEKFCFGMDAVLLSSFAKLTKGQRVLDLGTGTGILPFCYVQKRRLLLTKHWKFRKKVPIWHAEVLPIIIWKIRFMSQQEISVMHLKSTENSLLMLL